ncbi:MULTISPECIES: LPS export ABC transporter periplasmic protein LptC [Aphanothece]|uniref:LPS export ABC transporter periplasmic protein LptC n=1 Tax=Aphanothece TaxID=1121 RepID=UPI003984A34A
MRPFAAAGRASLGLGLLLPLLIAGCRAPEAQEERIQPFVFRSLNLRQQDAAGRPLWELTSPETRYDLSRRVAQSRDLRGVLYSQGRALYRFTAANGVVLNDGELVQLEGPTRVQRLDSDHPLVITAQRVRWYPARKLMEIDRSPLATQSDLRLTSQQVRFLIDQDRLELRGQPELVREGQDPLRLKVASLDWLPGSGDLRAVGPVRGQRLQPDSSLQTLTAPSLRANTRTQIIDLAGPVRLSDPAKDGSLEARQARLDLAGRLVSTAEPFTGRLGRATLSGDRLRLDLAATTAEVGGACRLTQPGDLLTAARCHWNWSTGAVEAVGGVTLRRQDPDQVTRSERLAGRVAKNGFVQFGGSGGRVTTEFRLPPGGQPGLPGAPADPDTDRKRKRPAIAL